MRGSLLLPSQSPLCSPTFPPPFASHPPFPHLFTSPPYFLLTTPSFPCPSYPLVSFIPPLTSSLFLSSSPPAFTCSPTLSPTTSFFNPYHFSFQILPSSPFRSPVPFHPYHPSPLHLHFSPSLSSSTNCAYFFFPCSFSALIRPHLHPLSSSTNCLFPSIHYFLYYSLRHCVFYSFSATAASFP